MVKTLRPTSKYRNSQDTRFWYRAEILLPKATLVATMCSTLFLLSCNTAQQPAQKPAGAVQRQYTPEQSNAAAQASLLAIRDMTAGINYRIMPMDKLDISVFQIPDLAKTVEVNQSGMITLPLVGMIQASGLTVEELQHRIEQSLARDYLQDPQVTVSVREYSNRRITVSGSVSRPGVFPLTGETTLLQAIAQGGGIEDIGDPAGVFVFRGTGANRQVARFDVKSISVGQSPDPILQAGDVVIVDRSTGRVLLRDLRAIVPIAGLFVAIASAG